MKEITASAIVTVRTRKRISIPLEMWMSASRVGFEKGTYLSIHTPNNIHTWNFVPFERVTLNDFNEGDCVRLSYSSKDKFIKAEPCNGFPGI